MHSKDGSMNDRVLEMESSEIISYTDTICDGEVPVVPESFSVVENDSLSEVMRCVSDEVDTVAERLSIGNRFFVPVE